MCSKLRRAKKKKEKKSPKARQKLFHAIWCLLPAGLVGRYVPSWEECTQTGWQERSTSFCLPNAASPPPVGCSRIRRDSLSLPLAAAGKMERQKKGRNEPLFENQWLHDCLRWANSGMSPRDCTRRRTGIEEMERTLAAGGVRGIATVHDRSCCRRARTLHLMNFNVLNRTPGSH